MAVFQPMPLATDPPLSGQAPSHIFGCVRTVTWGVPQLMVFSVGLILQMGLVLSNLLPRSKCGRGLAPDGGVSANASGD